MSTTIAWDEWLKALDEAGVAVTEDDQGAISIRDFQAMFGLSERAAKSRLEKLVAAGKASRTRKWHVTEDGRRRHLLAYRLT